MGAVGVFLIGIWNYVVGIAPIVVHAACQLTDGAATAVKLGGGS